MALNAADPSWCNHSQCSIYSYSPSPKIIHSSPFSLQSGSRGAWSLSQFRVKMGLHPRLLTLSLLCYSQLSQRGAVSVCYSGWRDTPAAYLHLNYFRFSPCARVFLMCPLVNCVPVCALFPLWWDCSLPSLIFCNFGWAGFTHAPALIFSFNFGIAVSFLASLGFIFPASCAVKILQWFLVGRLKPQNTFFHPTSLLSDSSLSALGSHSLALKLALDWNWTHKLFSISH